MPMPGAQKGPKRDRFSPRSLQSERIEVDYEELVLVKDSLDFLRILRLGQCQHEEDARLLRVVHHGAHKALLREFADGCHMTCSNAGINHDHDALAPVLTTGRQRNGMTRLSGPLALIAVAGRMVLSNFNTQAQPQRAAVSSRGSF